jgi:8-oxo-dGTP pyrophosphatase MutT (NUDIX family)
MAVRKSALMEWKVVS